MKLRSIPETSRLTVIDLLRGVAILGILLVNMIDFHAPFLYMQADYWDGADFYTYAFVDIFAQGNFYPMFVFIRVWRRPVNEENNRERYVFSASFFEKDVVSSDCRGVPCLCHLAWGYPDFLCDLRLGHPACL